MWIWHLWFFPWSWIFWSYPLFRIVNSPNKLFIANLSLKLKIKTERCDWLKRKQLRTKTDMSGFSLFPDWHLWFIPLGCLFFYRKVWLYWFFTLYILGKKADPNDLWDWVVISKFLKTDISGFSLWPFIYIYSYFARPSKDFLSGVLF